MVGKAKKVLSLFLALTFVFSVISVAKVEVGAAFNRASDITYSYSTGVTVGKIRYIAQTNSSREIFSDYFYSDYWYNGDARWGCFVASTSMALSYMGVNMTPKKLYENGLVSGGNNMAGSSNVASKVSSTTGISISSLFSNGVQTSFTTLDNAINNFQNGNGMYSPPIVWTSDSSGGTHYFLVTKKLSANLYEMVDPISEINQKVNLVSYATSIVYGNGGTAKGTLSDIVQYKRNTALPSTTYTIRYSANGGTVIPAAQKVDSGKVYTIPSTIPQRFGYTFKGWSTSSSATSATYRPGDTFNVTGDKTLYAVWSAATSVNKNGSYTANLTISNQVIYFKFIPSQTSEYVFESTGSIDSKVNILNSSKESIGHDDDSGEGFNFRLCCNLNAGETYYIQIEAFGDETGYIPFSVKEVYTITYNANGGSGAPATQTKVHNQDITLSTDEPTRSGYRFLGWSTSSTATTPEYASGATYSENGNETLYAVWASSHTHSYVGTVTKAATCTTSGVKTYKCSCGASYTQTIAATGHKASGWITETTASVYTAGLRYKECTVCKAVLQTEKTPQIVPAKVNLVEVANITQGIKVTWNDVAGADSYKVFRKVGGESWKCIATTRVSEFTDETAEPGIAYYYTVRGINEGGNGSYDTAGLYITRIGTPELTKIANGKNYVQIKWGAVEEAESYIVYRRTYNSKTKAWSGWATLQTDVAGTSYVDKTAKTGTYYIYTVKATNETGYSAHTSGIKTYYLATPQITSVANAANGVTVQWGKIAGAKGYYVYRKTTGGWTKLGSTTGTAFKDKTAKAGETYKYTVRAYYGSYLSSYNSSGVAIVRLTAPVLKNATSAKSGVTVKWGKVAGATGYIVYRKTGNGGWQKIATVKGNAKVSYLDKTAKKGTTYTYTVKAYSGSYKSAHNTTGLKIKDKY